MKKPIYFLSILLLSACSSNPSTDQSATETPATRDLGKTFADINPDSLYVYSIENTEDKNYKFAGRLLDSSIISIFPYYVKGDQRWKTEYFGCYKFAIDSSRIALVTRVPGEYVSSSLQLFIYDIQKDSVTQQIDLADLWGDAGEFSEHNSCIFYSPEKELKILSYYWSSYDHSVDQETEGDTLIEYWEGYLLRGLSKNAGDTLSKDSAEIVRNYPAMLEKMLHRETPVSL
ncbi:MAG: hypothetical protein JWO09_3513 [Bacteroidetes bacterium]|nr:hypothetical protein [Bacteroidota bacterium]